MKKHLLKSLLLIAALVMGAGSAWADQITATLDHTGSSSRDGSNAITTTVDVEKEHYNNTKAAAWGGWAYAQFSFAIPEGQGIKSATLTWSTSIGGTAGKNRDNSIYYLNAGTSIDWESLTATTNLNLTGNGTLITTKNLKAGSEENPQTTDVTDAVKAVAASQTFIIFEWTNSASGADLWGKKSTQAPTLVIETVSADSQTTYTVKYTDGTNELKAAQTYNMIIGEQYTASAADMASFVIDGKKWIYASGNTTATSVADAASNVITLVFREAATWSYTVNAMNASSKIAEIANGSTFEGEEVKVPYHYYYNIDSTLYKKDALNKEYNYTFTLNSDNQVEELAYTASSINNVIFLSEAEDIATLTAVTGGGVGIRCSNSSGAFADEEALITTLTPGKYKLTGAGYGGNLVFKAGTVEILNMETVGYQRETPSEEFVIYTNTNITFIGGSNNNAALDYVFIQKTGDVTAEEIALAEAKAALKADIDAAKAIDTTGKKLAESLANAITEAETQLNAAEATVENLQAAQMVLAKVVEAYYIENAKNIFLKPGVWNVDGARYAAYVWNDKGDKTWFDFYGAEGDSIYTTQIPEYYSGLILARINPNGTDEDPWKNVWNQTADIDFAEVADSTLFTITGWNASDFETSKYEKAEPVKTDYTEFIINADLTNAEIGWDAAGTKTDDYKEGAGIVKAGNNAQFDFKQTVEALPAGQYKLTAQAAYRYSGSEGDEYAAINAGTDTKLATLYAIVGKKTVSTKVQNRYDGASDTDYAAGNGSTTVNEKFVPNSSSAVKAWFAAGQYVNEVIFNLPADGDVTIGIVKTAQPEAGDYTVIGPWTLTRLGDAEEEPEPEVPTLANGDFEGEYTVYSNPSGDRAIYQPEGWTVSYNNGDSNDMTALNSECLSWNNFENKPQLSETGGNNSYWVRFRWGNSETLTLSQQVTLAAGNYKLSADAFFNGANGASATISAAGQSTAITGNSTWANHKIVFTVTEEGPVTIALNFIQTQQVENIAAFDNVKLEIVEDIYADLKAEVAAALEAKQSAKTKATLEAALATFTAEENETNAEALKAALAAAKISIDSYKILETGIIPDNSLEGWTCTTKRDGRDVRFQVNTWSSEGNSDGTNMKTPFIENWTPKELTPLPEGEIYYELPGLDPGIYSFTALIRAYSESGNAPTGASLFAMDREKEFATGKSFEYNNMKGIYDTYAMSGQVGEDGIFRFGIKVSTDANFNWMAFKNCRVAYVGAAITEESINELAATMPEGKMNADVKTAAENAIAAAKANIGIDTYEAAQVAVAAAQASAAAYASAKSLLDDVDEVLANTNVYTAEAYETFNTAHLNWKAKYEDGSLTDDEANSLRKDILPSSYILGTDTWHWASTIDNFLLSAWDTNPDFVDAPYYINTWSTEGNNDGSEFRVPFFEYWTSDANSLGEKTLTATMSNLPEGKYNVTTLVRVRMKNGAEAPAYGITFQANEGEAVNVTGDQVGETQMYLKEVTATGTVAQDGVLNIKFNVAADNNISWLSFKNVKFEKVEPTKYYVVGTMNGWDIDENFKMTLNEEAEGVVEYMITLDLEANAELKVVKGNKDVWYPDGTGNNYVIDADGTYTIYFRPNADGGDDWYQKVIYVAKKENAQPEFPENVIYSWESPEGTPIEKGGKIAYVNGDGDRLNYQNSGYYTICLNGKKAKLNDEAASADAGHMVITLDNAVAEGDTIAITGYITKNSSSKSSAWIVFENGATAESAVFGDESNIFVPEGGEATGAINTKYVIVSAEAADSKTITLTRGQTGTNLFITKLQIMQYDPTTGISIVKTAIENGAIYNLNGQKVNKAQKGLYIINGKKVVIK